MIFRRLKDKKTLTHLHYHWYENPLAISLGVLVLLAVGVLGLSLPYYRDDFYNFYAQVLAEAHGMLFDIAVIGILIFWLNRQGEKRRFIRTYLDEIDDFRTWQAEEAAFRTAGNIKRLNRYHIYTLELEFCYLAYTNLNEVCLDNSNLNSATLSHARLAGARLRGTRLNQTLCNAANLNRADLSGAYANGASFEQATLIQADLSGAGLICANFCGAILMEANLRGCDLSGAQFEGANLFRADLRGAIGLEVQQLAQAKNLALVQLDPHITEALQLVLEEASVKKT